MQYLLASNFSKGADYVRGTFHINARGISLEDLARPSFWTHVSNRLRPGDLIDVVDETGLYDVTLRVIKADPIAGAETRLLRIWQSEKMTPEAPLDMDAETKPVVGLTVKHAGRGRWRVVRDADGKFLREGLESREAAEKWAEENAAYA